MFLLLSVFLAGRVPVCLGEASSTNEPSVPYRVRLKGIRFGQLKDAVRAQSLTFLLVKYPPATLRQLQRRAEDDLSPMTSALKASGYLGGILSVDIDTNHSPVRVTFQIQQGTRYVLESFKVAYAHGSDEVPEVPRRFGWRKGAAASVENVETAEQAVLRFLQKRGYPNPRIADRNVVRDDVHKTVSVTCTVDPESPATMGAPEFQGLVRLRPAYVHNRVSWISGEPYDIEELENFEKGLLRSGLFASTRVTLAEKQDDAGNLPVRVALTERPRRTVRAGVSYYTDEGFGGQASWENRNLFGSGEVISLALLASELKYEAKSVFTRPDMWKPDLDLHLEVVAGEENPDAYRSRMMGSSLWLEKRLWDDLTLRAGTAYEYDQVRELGEETRFDLVSLPLSANWDLRDDSLDPFKGANFFLATTPYWDVGNDLSFLKSFGEASFFLPLLPSPRVSLAARGALGTISGEEVGSVPADKRFYAGGGGTIRGYPFQSVGELVDGKPTGGNSIANVSAELRARVSRSLGLALFIDGGTAYVGSHPDADTPFLWGAGCGVRYYMGTTPFRFDVAFPLQPREGVDDSFQVYISLGQSF